jgi:phosphoribosylformylglycinamidine cyclo-ligase
MVVCIAEKDLEQTLELLQKQGESVWKLGYIEASEGAPSVEIQS